MRKGNEVAKVARTIMIYIVASFMGVLVFVGLIVALIELIGGW